MSTPNESWASRALASGVLKYIAYQATSIAAPVVVAGLTFLAGFLGDSVPWVYAIAAASVAFGATSVGTFFVFELLGKRAVEDKLQFAAVRLAKDATTAKLCLGFEIHSTCLLPLEWELTKLQSCIDGHYPPKKDYPLTVLPMAPGGFGFFLDYSIEKDVDYLDKAIAGVIEAKIAYGRPGKRKYELAFKRNVVFTQDSKTNQLQVSWSNAL